MKHQNMKVLFEGWRRFINENENKHFVDDIDEIAKVMIDSIKTKLENGSVDDDFVEKVEQLRGQALTTIVKICQKSGVDPNLCKKEFNYRLEAELLNIQPPEE